MSNVGARQVGEFGQPRRMIRSVMNPLDKATIVSIYPREISEVKETTQPSRYTVPAGNFLNPSVLIVGPATWWRDYDIEQPIQQVPVSAVQVADAVIRDYCSGLLGVEMGSVMPGFFFVPGEFDRKKILADYTLELDTAKARQNNWFNVLINIADSLWAKGNGNPLVIWELMRMAAVELGTDTKPWLKNFQLVDMIKCFACGGLRNPEYPICPNCKVIDQKHPMAKDIKFAV